MTPPRVLSIDPTCRGLAFVFLDAPHQLLDWGLKGMRSGKGEAFRFHVKALLDLCQPDVLVLEDLSGTCFHRRTSAVTVLAELAELAYERDIAVAWLARAQVRQAFGARDKYTIAAMVAAHFPELAPRLPAKRRIWQSEPDRINLFDAASFALTYYLHEATLTPLSTAPICDNHDAA